MEFHDKLTNELYNAVKMILMDLFTNKEHYYYVTLVTDGGAHTPCISAWSYEALCQSNADKKEQAVVKWSYADSPYCCWQQEKLEKADRLLLSRKNIWELDAEGFGKEHTLRLKAMEKAVKRLDEEGIFGINQNRSDVIVLVEVMPPDYTNTKRAYRMNCANSKVFTEWLKEAAEPLEDY